MLTLFGPLNLLSKIAGGFLIGALLFVTLLWKVEQRGHAKASAHIVKLSAQLKKLSDPKNEQVKTTVRTVEKAKVIYRTAERQAERIEAAPVVGKCETPSVIMGADL